MTDRWGDALKKESERIAKLKPKPKTYHEGANDERTAILAKVRRMIRMGEARFPAQSLEVLVEWLLQRSKRYKKNPGGL